MADAENIAFVMDSAYVVDTDCMKRLADRGIVAFFAKELFGFKERSGGIPQHRDKSEETLVYDIVIQLLFHIWIE